MSKISLGKLFAWAFCLSALPLFLFIRYGEEHGTFDSIGLWYTIYGTVVFASLLGAGVAAFAALARTFRNVRASPKRERTDA